MSEWDITNETIDTIAEHPNADRLEIAKLIGMDYLFCVPKGVYLPGDSVIYFPIDTVMPHSLIERLGLVLTGKEKNRVKSIRLRGTISQGVVCKPDDIIDLIEDQRLTIPLSEALGCSKYEPPEEVEHGDIYPLPSHVRVYDVENAEKHPEIVSSLWDESVLITEKLEGSHFAATLDDGSFVVCQRRYAIKPGQDHTWLKVAERAKVRDALELLQGMYGRQPITVRGEVVGPGIQGNIYGFRQHQVFFYDMEVGGEPPEKGLEAFHNMQKVGLPTVPEIWLFSLSGWCEGKSLRDRSNGFTYLDCPNRDACMREGVVIRPAVERWSPEVGRIIIKQRSPEYLARSDS